MPFGLWTQNGPRNHDLDGFRIPRWEGANFRERVAHCKVYGLSAVSCAETTKPIDLPLVLWTWVGWRKHEFNHIHQMLPLCTVSIVFSRWHQCTRWHSSVSCAKTAEPVYLPFGLWTQVSQRKHKFDRICLVAPMCLHGRAHWCHLANMIQLSVSGSDVVLCQITLPTCSDLNSVIPLWLIMAALWAGHYILRLCFLLFFLAYFQQSQIGCLWYFHTWCGLSANLECRSEMCCMQIAEYTGCKICHLHTAVSTPRVFTIYGELQPTNGSDWLASLGHPSKFQRVSRLGFVTAPTSLNSGQPNFARCLAICSAGTLYIHLGGLLPPNGIMPGAEFTLRPSFAVSYIGSITAQHSSTGRAAITFSISPYSSLCCIALCLTSCRVSVVLSAHCSYLRDGLVSWSWWLAGWWRNVCCRRKSKRKLVEVLGLSRTRQLRERFA